MTEEGKEILFDYLTHQITPTTSSTNDVILEEKTYNMDFSSYLPSGITDFGRREVIHSTNDTIILNCFYEYNSTYYGAIFILDSEFNVLKAFTEYDSGTKLRVIQRLVQAEDNTFYGVDGDFINPNKEVLRFIMLNNFSIPDENGNFSLKLRKSYYFTNNVSSTYYYGNVAKIKKDPSSSLYVIVLNTIDMNNSATISLKVEVGQSNVWTTYPCSTGVYIEVVEIFFNNSQFCVSGTFSYNNYLRFLKLNYGASSYTVNNILTPGEYTLVQVPIGDSFISEDKFLFEYEVDTTVATSYLKLYDNGTVTTIASYTGTVNENDYMIYRAVNVEGTIFILSNKFRRPVTFYFGKYDNGYNPIELDYSISGAGKGYFLNYVKKYNLITFFTTKITSIIAGTMDIHTFKEDYNTSNYNSNPYVDTDSIIPQKVRLYSNNVLVFARNKYNISTLGGQYTVTFEVPNSYLNDSAISKEEVIGTTNVGLLQNLKNITKNIYEKVFLNISNTITSYDYDTGRTFDTSKLVKSISGTGSSYSQSSIRNWTTTKNGEVVDRGQINNFTKLGRLDGEFYIEFTPTGEADRLNFVDTEDNVHAWIDISNCEVGKTYNIYQKVRLSSDKMELYNVLYNDDIVQYNGNDVLYYGNK